METYKLYKMVNENHRGFFFFPSSTASCSLHSSAYVYLSLFPVCKGKKIVPYWLRYKTKGLFFFLRKRNTKKGPAFHLLTAIHCAGPFPLQETLYHLPAAVQVLGTAEQQWLGGNLQVYGTTPKFARKSQGPRRTDCQGSPGLGWWVGCWAQGRDGGNTWEKQLLYFLELF